MSAITSRAMQVDKPGTNEFRPVQVETPDPGLGQVRITVEACGICHSDAGILSGHFPGVSFPCITGHELAGRIESIGIGVSGWQVGDRVVVGWYGGSCGHCAACRSGDGTNCPDRMTPGVAYPGGYADHIVVPAMALARIPNGISATEAGPMGCAGVTVYNALRNSDARTGDLVAVLGIGGLGHLGVQFAAQMGFRVAAIARGADKSELARQLGAHHYIDSRAQDVATALNDLGGAKVVLATATNAAAMSATIDGLGRRGELIAAGISADSLTVNSAQLVHNMRRVSGHASGTSLDVEDTLRFAAQTGVRPWIETAPLSDAGAAFSRMLSGEARFRMVLTTGL
jgi:D-arabinose 1-dehydrogenase-like Zn-dependent alcohol dehydrogenase